LTANASAVLAAVEKKLPQGEKNIRNTMVKFTMGKTAKLAPIKKDKDKKRTE
jgi:large subunit ribosomal protein L1